jgi:ABC-type multidrug transport system ATPase subunit
MLRKLKEQGITILVSTPYMDEAGSCDQVALMQSGRVLSVNTPQGITRDFKKPLVAVRADNMLSLLDDLKAFEETDDAYPFGEYHHVVMKNELHEQVLRRYLEQRTHKGVELKSVQAGIEDCFIALMKE